MRRLAWCFVAVMLFFIGVYGLHIVPWRLALNRTESLPLGLYLSVDHQGALKRGTLACFSYHEPSWARGRYLPDGSQICKEVLGVPGDRIEQQGSALYLLHDGRREALGELLNQDSQGRPVPPRDWNGTTLGPGQYYLGSTRVKRSFDSRYLGLIDQGDLRSRIYPLFTYH